VGCAVALRDAIAFLDQAKGGLSSVRMFGCGSMGLASCHQNLFFKAFPWKRLQILPVSENTDDRRGVALG
jgi:hypothetical protein